MAGNENNQAGFKPSFMKNEHQEQDLIGDIDKEYAELLDEFDQERTVVSREVKIMKKFRKELVLINKEIKKLHHLYSQRMKVNSQAWGVRNTDPQKSLRLLDDLRGLDRQIVDMAAVLERELEKHTIDRVKEIYGKTRVEEDQWKHIGEVVQMLHSKVMQLSAQSKQDFNGNMHANWQQQIKQHQS